MAEQAHPDDLPTPRSTLRSRYTCVLVWCKSCRHQREADLQALIDAGRGDCFPSLSDRSLSVVASHENARTRPSHICP